MFKITGTLKVKNDTVQVSEKFSKRDFVITDNQSMYPQDILFQLSQDKCSLIDNTSVGSTIEVSFNLRGREWTSPQGEVRYFNTLDAWRIETVAGYTPQPVAQAQPPINGGNETENTDDDLPF